MMNIQGSNIGTKQIAVRTGISPGNIYYYFNNFSEIALEVVSRLRSELFEILALPAHGPVNPTQVVGYYSGGAEVLWRYRFVISSGRELTHRSPELESSFREFTNEGIEAVRRILENLFEYNPGTNKVDQSLCRSLAENMWVLWSAWPRHVETKNATDQTNPQEIAKGLQQVALILVPYVDVHFYRQVDEGLLYYVSNLKENSA